MKHTQKFPHQNVQKESLDGKCDDKELAAQNSKTSKKHTQNRKCHFYVQVINNIMFKTPRWALQSQFLHLGYGFKSLKTG